MSWARLSLIRPTRAGWGIAASLVLCFVLARMLGVVELDILAAALAAVLVLACLSILWRWPRLQIGRTATPALLRVGIPARVDLEILNERAISTPVLRADDRIDGTVVAQVHLAPIAGRRMTALAYRLPTGRRGERNLGPLDLLASDPFGLLEMRQRATDQITVTVRPALVDLGALRATAGFDPTADVQPVRSLAQSGDEFYALRPYVPGDEPRRVDWKASARNDDLVVRQVERPRAGRVTIVLDTQQEYHDDETLDRACSVAVSALSAAWRGGDAIRFLTSVSGTVSDVASRRDLDALDERLAVIAPSRDASILHAVDELTRAGHGGTVVLITGNDSVEFAAAVEAARRTFGLVVPVLCGAGHTPAPGSAPTSGGSGAGPGRTTGAIVHDGDADLAPQWRTHLERTRR